MKTVLITEPIHPDGIARFEAAGLRVVQGKGLSPADLARAFAEADAVACRTSNLSAEVLSQANKLSVVAKHGSVATTSISTTVPGAASRC